MNAISLTGAVIILTIVFDVCTAEGIIDFEYSKYLADPNS